MLSEGIFQTYIPEHWKEEEWLGMELGKSYKVLQYLAASKTVSFPEEIILKINSNVQVNAELVTDLITSSLKCLG